MKVLNRNQYLPVDCPMRGVRAVLVCLLTALALSGCMRRSAPVAVAQPAVYAAPMPAPMPVAYDAAYRLDAGDRLRIVVYGQEGLTNTYAIDAGGSITLPLIGSVPARRGGAGRPGAGDKDHR